jgi:hypothetical protein
MKPSMWNRSVISRKAADGLQLKKRVYLKRENNGILNETTLLKFHEVILWFSYEIFIANRPNSCNQCRKIVCTQQVLCYTVFCYIAKYKTHNFHFSVMKLANNSRQFTVTILFRLWYLIYFNDIMGEIFYCMQV